MFTRKQTKLAIEQALIQVLQMDIPPPLQAADIDQKLFGEALDRLKDRAKKP